ncbi:MAG TPA: MoxR family ATPase [Blastocatellia bacterium]|nr:MoxR family ATPase [Blastocatellia bacterium]
MRPKDPTQSSLHPRRLASAQGADEIARVLSGTGYIIRRRTMEDLWLALDRGLPLLAGGPAGTGKTALAEALAASCNLTLYEITGHPGQEPRDVIGAWNRRDQDRAEDVALAAGWSVEAARAERWREDFFECGEVLDAYREAARAGLAGEPPPVLLIDETEKLPVPIQHILLQPLARGFISIPKLNGVIGVHDRRQTPIVILTTNNLDLLDDPLKDRCVLTWVAPPTVPEEIRIFRARVPRATPTLLGGTVKMLRKIRNDMDEITNKPGIRNAVLLLEAMADHAVESINKRSLERYIGCLARTDVDDINLRDALPTLERAANRPDPIIDDLVKREFEVLLCGNAA